MSDQTIPDYQPLLAAYHRGFAAELRAMIAALPLAAGDRVLDVACGDGAYTALLADRVGAKGLVVAVDLLPAYVEMACRAASGRAVVGLAADLARLPVSEGTFDLAWCAQSLYSLPDPVAAVRHMAHAVRPGGTVALLENDTLHQLILPWPIEMELAVRHAEWQAFRADSDRPRKFYVGRQLRRVCGEAGLERVTIRTYATDRVAPLAEPERAFLLAYFRDLGERTSPFLDRETQRAFERLVSESSPAFLPDQPDFTMTILDHVVCGVVPRSDAA